MSVKVGIIMGSDSDLPVMSKAAEILDELQVPYELTIVSAHRTPDRLCEYAKTAEEKGLSVIIAGAGGAAHLPGMTAAMTVLPVIDKGSWRCGFSLFYRPDATGHTGCYSGHQWCTECRTSGSQDSGHRGCRIA